MSQNDREKTKILDFPLDPTPSLKAYRQFTSLIHQYLSMFNSTAKGISVGPICIGTPDRPLVTAPIEMDPREIEQRLRQTIEILETAVKQAVESIKWTRRILDQTSPGSPEADNRIKCLEEIVAEVEGLLNQYKGFAWHPRCYEQIRERIQSSFIPGEPGIPIQITILV